jgi:heme a synthase
MNKIKVTAQIALVLIFLVILAGSVVRMTGSGMGCPDWPKCFGHLIPPTRAEQVQFTQDSDYKKGQMIVYEDALWVAKEHFTSGKQINPDNWIPYTRHDYAVFNPVHTWIEYINRLLGALSGIPVLMLFVFSMLKVRSYPFIALLSVATVIGLGYEAWLGKLVVDGNLIPHQITQHMLGSLAIVFLLLVIISRSGMRSKVDTSLTFRVVLIIGLLLMIVQIFLGTQVREQIDEIARTVPQRTKWIDMLDSNVLIHRSFSLALLLLISWLYWRNFAGDYNLPAIKYLFMLTLLEVLGGAIMYYLSVPRFVQPVHLMLSTGMFAAWVWAIMRTQWKKKEKIVSQYVS